MDTLECDVCGREASYKRKAMIDGAVMSVCEGCLSLGREIIEPRPGRPVPISEEIVDDLVPADGFGEAIRAARERMGLGQEELASRLGVKSSVIRRMERGFEADSTTMRKVGRFFSIKLYEKPAAEAFREGKGSEGLTLGDIASVRKRKARSS